MHTSDQLLKDTKFVIEATSNERQMLWERFSHESIYLLPVNTSIPIIGWEQINPGYSITVGDFHGYPINIVCIWAKLNGVLVMFWEAVSMVTHSGMIGNWLKANCAPRWDKGTRLAHTNAQNFHHVLEYVRDETRR